MGIIWESFTYIFKDRDWIKKLFKGGVIGIIPFLNISLIGYMIEFMNSIYWDKNKKLPEFNIINQFITGLKILIIFSIYFSVIFTLFLILFIIIFAIFLAIFNLNDDILDVFIIISLMASILLLQVALPHYTYTNRISSLYDFYTLYKILEKTWFSILIFDIIYFIVALIALVLISIIAETSSIFSLVAIWLMGAFFYYSFIAFGYSHGNIYLQGIGKPIPEAKTVNTSKVDTSKPIYKRKVEVLESTNTIPDFPRELLEKYIPLQKLGEGGFGKVFKVKRKGGTLPLAIKVPNLEERAKKYLLKEINAWKNLNHPNIVKFYDAFIEPIPHIEMEYIGGYKLNGKTVKDLDKYPKPTNPEEAIKLIKGIAEGLKHAHNKDIIHRDIKPSNILLTENLTPKITDWGLAKIGAKSTTATTTKGLTLLYSAPEQIDEEEYGKTDKRTDIYQLGLIFYELLTGKLPYEGNTPTQVSLKIVNPSKKPTPPSKIDPKLSIFDGIFEKLLAKRKENRYQSIEEFLEALNSIEDIIKEKEKFKDTLTKTTQILKTSTDKREIKKLTKNLIETTAKLALNCARVNDKVGLLDTLELLKDYAKSEESKKELEGAISHIEYLIKEGLPIGGDTIERLEVLLNRIKREGD
ncbi:protein kinase [Methanothermococcus sp. SCGC AD-155-C09]|nr:protein kinase [Methanothermococcus sp. SCGC AD-155-C09]